MGGLIPKRWLITGVSGGLGRALAEAALGRGDRVVGTVRDPAAVGLFEAQAPGRAHALVADLADSSSLESVVKNAAAVGDGLDLLVNNAGYALAGAVEEVSLEEAQAILAVNLLAPLALVRFSLPHLRISGRGRIINVTSMAALQGLRGLGLYCASKSALAALSETLDVEAAHFGIRAISVEATALRTSFAGASLRRTAASLPEYAAMRAEMDAAFARSNGCQANDPRKAAEALIALAELSDPPRHFAIGFDAAERIETLLDSRIEEYRRFATLGRETAY